MPFHWHPEEPPPLIEGHSKAKLNVLRRYLRAYLDRLGSNLYRDEFKLDLVDGFAGGGTFRDGDKSVPGTPLIMLEESETAKGRLNRNRTKPLHFDFKYYFVDVDENHTSHLRKVLSERGYQIDNEKIVVRNSPFEAVVGDIIAEIRRRQPRVGRSLFLLDQCGFSQVEISLVKRIFQELPAAEVILTFATETLINLLSERPEFVQAVASLDLTKEDIHEWIQLKNGDGGKALVQRVFRKHIRTATNAAYDTPFFIRPRKSRRALWFLHLSRHPTARDVMFQCHWESQNTFAHYGPGGFGMLGWEAFNSKSLPLFQFDDLDKEKVMSQLRLAMPEELYRLASESPISVDAVRHMFANKTTARSSDLYEIILQLAQDKEIDILNPDGKRRSRKLKRLNLTDRIALPAQQVLPGIFRRKRY